jgi:hypothetical protein
MISKINQTLQGGRISQKEQLSLLEEVKIPNVI